MQKSPQLENIPSDFTVRMLGEHDQEEEGEEHDQDLLACRQICLQVVSRVLAERRFWKFVSPAPEM